MKLLLFTCFHISIAFISIPKLRFWGQKVKNTKELSFVTSLIGHERNILGTYSTMSKSMENGDYKRILISGRRVRRVNFRKKRKARQFQKGA